MPAKRTFTKGKKPLTAKGTTVVQKEVEKTEELKPKAEEVAEETPAETPAEPTEKKVEEIPAVEEETEDVRAKTDEKEPEEEPQVEEKAEEAAPEEPVEEKVEEKAPEEEAGVVGMYDATESGETAAAEEAPAEQAPESGPVDEGKGGLIKTIGFILVGLILLGGVAFAAYQYGLSQGKNEAVKKAESEAAAKPTPTEAAEVDSSEFTISVLNGSGKSGEASTLEKKLEEEGFTVDKIGNAEDDIEKTIIKAKKDVSSAFIDKLTEELAKTYSMGDKEGLSTGDTDVVVIIGSETAK